MRKLLIRNHFAEVGDVLFEVGDLLGPGVRAFVGDSGGVFSLGFGEAEDHVL